VPVLKIEGIEWNEHNEFHATRHGVSAREIEQAMESPLTAHTNKRGRSGDYIVQGRTAGGRRIKVVFAYDAGTRVARPITAWEV
jgi:uncharacterized DUF497 family protein